MSSAFKRVRHYYWFFSVFLKKNIKFLITSFVSGFFIILVLINLFPLLNTFFLKQKEIVGIAGKYTLLNPPEDVLRLISSPLITVDQNGEIQPVLAHSWETLNSGKTYRFHLKNDLYWSDKKKFTAKEIKYTLKDVDVKVIDDYTIDFNLKQALVIFPIYLTQPVIKYPLEGVGSLYSVQSYRLEKNILKTIYLSPNKPGAALKVYKFYNTEEDLINAYKKGEITSFNTLNRTLAESFVKWKNTKIDRNVDYSQIITLFINTRSGMLEDRDVRKALAYASPQFNNFGVPAKGPLPPTSWAYTDDVKTYTLNEERAINLLEKPLSSASASAKLKLYTFFDYADIAEQLKRNYENVGLKISLKILSYIPTDFDLLLTSWTQPSDPDQYFFWHSTQQGTNITRLNNVKVDKLLEDGRRIINVKQREKIYKDFQKTIVEEVQAYFLYDPF